MKYEDYNNFMKDDQSYVLRGTIVPQYVLQFSCDADFNGKWYDVSGMTLGEEPITTAPQGIWSAEDEVEITLTIRCRVKDVYPDAGLVEVWDSEGSISVRKTR